MTYNLLKDRLDAIRVSIEVLPMKKDEGGLDFDVDFSLSSIIYHAERLIKTAKIIKDYDTEEMKKFIKEIEETK